MFKDNPLLQQLKQEIQQSLPKVEGTIKATTRGFGFLETDNDKSYFVPPPFMRKVMHGDRVIAIVRTENDKEQAEPDQLVEPFLGRFIGRVQIKKDRISVVPDHPSLNTPINARPLKGFSGNLAEGDWVVAQMKRHALTDKGFFAEITDKIADADDPNQPWWVTLARHDLSRHSPQVEQEWQLNPAIERRDLTHIPFYTIDSASTKDMDDALYIEPRAEGGWTLTVAIADPTAYIAPGSELDEIAKARGFTLYLPGRNITMLPEALSDELCSLKPGEERPALVARFSIEADGKLNPDVTFENALIRSHHKLVYDQVSDYLEHGSSPEWQPDAELAEQIRQLHQFALARQLWRKTHALIFPDRPDYRFELAEDGRLVAIHAEYRRIANQMVEEAMIAANICAADYLKRHVGSGIFNVHAGIDTSLAEQAAELLKAHGIEYDAERLLSLEGFCEMRRQLDNHEPHGRYLDSRLRKFQAFSVMSTEPGAHYGLGLDVYGTWTSPIRKYGDMINHRLLRAAIAGQESFDAPSSELAEHLGERRRLQRMAERDVGDWLYMEYLQPSLEAQQQFEADIMDIFRGGMRARLLENGAVVFIPGPLIHDTRSELVCDGDSGKVIIKEQLAFRVGDTIKVVLHEINADTRSLIAKPIF